MARERKIRARRTGLTPAKACFSYLLVFLFVIFHQSGRLADWFDDFGATRQGSISDISFNAATFLRTTIEPLGPAWLNQKENLLLDRALTFFNGDTTKTVEPLPGTAVESPISLKSEATGETKFSPEQALKIALEKSFISLKKALQQQDISTPENKVIDPVIGLYQTSTLKPQKVLLLGDSMMLEGIGPPLQKKLKNFDGLQVFRDGRYGTGLCRLDVFDWMAYFDEMLVKYNPDLVILTLGANDPQDILGVAGKKRIHIGTEQWDEIYKDRVKGLTQIAAKRKAHIFWIGLPVMGKEPYGGRVANINKLVQEGCHASDNCKFWDGWLSVADEHGKYTVFGTTANGKRVRIRAKDSIHLTESGGELMAVKFMEGTKDWANYQHGETEPHNETPTDTDKKSPPKADAGPEKTNDGSADEDAKTIAPAAGDGEMEGLIQHKDSSYKGVVTEKSYYSAARAKNTYYVIASPVNSKKMRTALPVVFLLHGAWDKHNSWLERIGPAKLGQLAASLNIIIVMPDGEPFGWYIDGPESSIETYIMKELLPHIMVTENADPKKIGISGLSMGGHGALTLALKYPDAFKAVSSMSGVLDITRHSDQQPINQALKIADLLGPYAQNKEKWRRHSATELTKHNPEALKKVAIFISVGLEDKLTLQENRDYANLLTKLKIKHIYQEDPGAHDWEYWSSELPVHLDFITGHLNK